MKSLLARLVGEVLLLDTHLLQCASGLERAVKKKKLLNSC